LTKKLDDISEEKNRNENLDDDDIYDTAKQITRNLNKGLNNVGIENNEYQSFVLRLKKALAQIFLDDFNSVKDDDSVSETDDTQTESKETTLNISGEEHIDQYIPKILQSSQDKDNQTNIKQNQSYFKQENTKNLNNLNLSQNSKKTSRPTERKS